VHAGILLRMLWARQGSELTVVSWNVQLMNKLDGPNDSEIAEALEDKAERISRVVAEPREAPRYAHDALGRVVVEDGLVRMEGRGGNNRSGRGHDGLFMLCRLATQLERERLKEQRLPERVGAIREGMPPHLSVLITGDFNLEPLSAKRLLSQDFALPGDHALPPGDHATFRSAAACPKTNIWRFNGCGSEPSDGHAYDTGFFSSTMKGHTASAALPPALAEQMQIHQEMKQMADAFKTLFGTEGPGVLGGHEAHTECSPEYGWCQ
jgi:hypothetical protein